MMELDKCLFITLYVCKNKGYRYFIVNKLKYNSVIVSFNCDSDKQAKAIFRKWLVTNASDKNQIIIQMGGKV